MGQGRKLVFPKAVDGSVIASLVHLYCLLTFLLDSLEGTVLHLSRSYACKSPQLTYTKHGSPQVQQHGNLLISSCLETTGSGLFVLLPPPPPAPLHSRHPDILKVHHSPLHSEQSTSTPLCFPWRRRQRKCQVLYW